MTLSADKAPQMLHVYSIDTVVAIERIKKRHELYQSTKAELLKLYKLNHKFHDEIYDVIMLRGKIDPKSTLLQNAIIYGCTAICEFLLQNGSSLDTTTLDGYNALHIAVIMENIELVKLFIKYINPSIQQELLQRKDRLENKTVFEWAKKCKNTEIEKIISLI